MPQVQIKRIYDKYEKTDGYRVLIDRLWPRGISKENAHLDAWMKDLAPSTDLRKWFDHKEERFEGFTKKYELELKDNKNDLEELLSLANERIVTLLYGAKDQERNQAVVLQQVLNKKINS